MKIFGKSPVNKFLFITGKTCLFICTMFFIVRLYWPESLLWKNKVNDIAAISLFIIGGFITLLSVINIGNALSIGLPENNTKLVTRGLYKFSRNSMYFGLFIILLASCLHAPHFINFILAIIAISVHHKIILEEEKFLKNRFGKEWDEYVRQVNRYLSFPSPRK